MQVAVVVHVLVNFVRQPRANRMDADWLGTRHLAHDIDIVHAAIDDRRDRIHQLLMNGPLGAGRLLIEIHPHNQRFTEGLADFDKLYPRRMNPQDITNHQFLAGNLCELRNLFGLGHRIGQGFFDKYVAARFQRQFCVGSMGIRPRIDRYGIGFYDCKGLCVI